MFPFNLNPYSFRNFRTRSTLGDAGKSMDQFTATLLRGQRAVATVESRLAVDESNSFLPLADVPHELSFEFESAAEQEYFTHFVSNISPGSELDKFIVEHDLKALDPAEAFICVLAYATYMENRLSEHCSRHTLFRLPGEDPSAWKVIKAPYRVALAKAIRRANPGAIIANEALQAAA